MSVTFNDDGSTATIDGRPFREYVQSVWEEEGTIDFDEFDPFDYEQIQRWVAAWKLGMDTE